MELSPFCKHTIAEIQFCSFYFFKTSGIFATSPEINVSQHILSICVGKINPFEFRIFFFFFFFFLRFSRFSRNCEKWSYVPCCTDPFNWRSLENRRKDTRLCMMFKIDRGMVAISKGSRLIPPNSSTRHSHPTELSRQSPAEQTREECPSFP